MNKLEVMSNLSVLIKKRVFSPEDVKDIVDAMGSDEVSPSWVIERICSLEIKDEEGIDTLMKVCGTIMATDKED